MSGKKDRKVWTDDDTVNLTSLHAGGKIPLDISVGEFKKTQFATGLSNDFPCNTLKRHLDIISKKVKVASGEKGKLNQNCDWNFFSHDFLVTCDSDADSNLEDYLDLDSSKPSKKFKSDEPATPDEKNGPSLLPRAKSL